MTSGQVSDLEAAVIVQVFRHDPQEEIAPGAWYVAAGAAAGLLSAFLWAEGA